MNGLSDYFNESKNKKLDLNGIVISEYIICKKDENCKVVLENSLIIFVLKGSKILKTKNSEYVIQAGNIVFAGKGSYIASQILGANDDKYEVIMISIDDSVIQEIFKINHNAKTTLNFEDDNVQVLKTNPFVESSLLSLIPYFDHDHQYKEIMVRNKIIELLINIMDADPEGKVKKFIEIQQKQLNSEFKNVLLKLYSEPLTVSEFAKKTNMSLSSFKKKFNETFNMPPKEWINGKRLEKAFQMMKNTNYSVTEICFLTGFENLSYFIRCFKNKFGETPKRIQLQQNR
jgi:AraC family transcriptional regulator, exoenzyme S synthesis regulatory protein ExsA